RGPHDVRRLRGHVHRELAGGPVEVGDRPARLDRRRVRARIVQPQLGDHVGLLEGTVGAVLVADLPRVDQVVVLARLVVADDRRPFGHRLLRGDERGQRLVLHVDQFAGVLGDVGVVGHDDGNFLTLEADLVGGQHRLGVVGQRGHPRQVAGGRHLAGQHQVNAGYLPRAAGVVRLDARVRDRTTQDLHVQYAGQQYVVDVVALAAAERIVLDAFAAGSESADLAFVDRRHAFSPRILWAAHYTALTMFW